MLAQHTVTGCPTNIGDLIVRVIISGKEPGSQGSLSDSNGKDRIKPDGGEQKTFLQDGDAITIEG